MNSPDNVREVTLPRGPTGTYVRLSAFHRPDDDVLVLFDVQAEAPGLSAMIGIETLGGDGLSAFVQSLDDDFRGWPDERVWTSFRQELELRAAHLGHIVRLSWTLRSPEPAEQDTDWAVTVNLYVSPGEELKNLASDVGHFLGDR
ncbi:DUF6228 family protein [Actinomadura alba]|uniref:Uncharacterized protein n=1 Tax=Actinomadura alba TaxID=406431 RepID=A0ABR7LQG7_9ACTN|nr:DUF6228 family protein [Actinomadura alba]MBC6466908.1 hypothetical protein [Actinomadura alba]